MTNDENTMWNGLISKGDALTDDAFIGRTTATAPSKAQRYTWGPEFKPSQNTRDEDI